MTKRLDSVTGWWRRTVPGEVVFAENAASIGEALERIDA